MSVCQRSALELVPVSFAVSRFHKMPVRFCLLQQFLSRTLLVWTEFRPLTRLVAMNIEGSGIQAKFTLNDGYKMPLFGLGVFKAVGDDCTKAVKFALQNGYRMIDTAALYG